MPDDVRFFDTTLRDGEQAPGIALTASEKLEIAEQLARLGVDIIEAGFPASSPGELDAVRRIAEVVKGSVIAALCRANDGDVDAAWEAVSPSATPRIHVFISTSDIHMDSMLRMSQEQVLDATRRSVRRAKGYTDDVEFSAQDATRTGLEFLLDVIRAAVEEGATTINVPDTVGYAMPHEFGELVRTVREIVPDEVVISTHCHNDLGLAVANSMAGVQNGARQVEVAVNGIGERAGNCSLEEMAMIVATRGQSLGLAHRPEPEGDRPDVAAGVDADRVPGAAEQGGRRRERVRPRVGHPPARRALEPRDVRDHEPRGDRVRGLEDRAGQALRAARVLRRHGQARARAGGRGAEPGVRAVQGAGRPQDLADRRRPRGDRRRGAGRAGGGRLLPREPRGRRRHAPGPHRDREAAGRRRGVRGLGHGRRHDRRRLRRDRPRDRRRREARVVQRLRGDRRQRRAGRRRRPARRRRPPRDRAAASPPTSSRPAPARTWPPSTAPSASPPTGHGIDGGRPE